MEGFICPECKLSFQTSGILENHFATHFEGPSIKSILSKAKDYTLSWMANPEEGADSVAAGFSSRPGSSGGSTPPPSFREQPAAQQLIGRANNLTKVFKAVRPKRLSHSQKEINKLHLRLDKLVTALLTEIRAGKKNLKEVERAVIPWTDEGDICVSCGEILSVLQLNRKHHCRLCTGILCSSCSKFVPLEEAVEAVELEVPGFLDGCQHTLRLCEKCQNIIHSAEEEIRAKCIDHSMENNYKKLMEAREKCDVLITAYTRISEGLRSGDANFTLEQGNVKRVELIRHFKVVDTLSERIAAVRTSSPSQQKLVANIRQATRSYLQDNLSATSPLPETAQIKEIQERRLEESKIVIRQQKEEALRTQIAISQPSKAPASIGQQPAHRDSWNTKLKRDEISRDIARERTREKEGGWTGETVQPATRSHPLIEQKEILRGYLRQAIRDDRKEEIETLKQNLHMILDEIKVLGLENT